MTARETILGRIREALRNPAPRPHESTVTIDAPAAGPVDWLPPVGPTLDDRRALFARNCADLKADFIETNNVDRTLRELTIVHGWSRIAGHHNDLTTPAVESLRLPTLWTDQPFDPIELEKCDVGITACDALIAQTGSVLLTSRSAGGRALSVLPPHHVVLATADQLIADLPSAFALLAKTYGTDYPDFITFVTGPSRTGDIERILVLGAHGPKKLTIVMRST